MEKKIALKQPLPVDRTYEQLLNHYLVEKKLADKLKASNRESRKEIYSSMYDELFQKVPDHPRLTCRDSLEQSAYWNKVKYSLVRRHVRGDTVFLEFAPGDCQFAYKIADTVREVFAVDISDQRSHREQVPDNFKLIVYDGYNLPEIKLNSIDIVFSFQLIEHLHHEDAGSHFELVQKILKPGGKYVFQTPHALSGPYDVSKYFSEIAEGFHLKEWTYREMKALVLKSGFSSFLPRLSTAGIDIAMPFSYFSGLEKLLEQYPGRHRRFISKRLIPMLYAVVIK